MDFYKKNPKIEGSIVVQGKTFDDETVVSGDKYKMFADPNTFPGIPPRLVKVDPAEMSGKQKEMAEESAEEAAKEPPRHLPITTSDSIGAPKVGGVKISTQPRGAVPPEREEEIPPPEPKKPVTEKQPKKLGELYSVQELADVFPGITEKNAKAILKTDLTLPELAGLSNAKLRKLGVTPSFYKRIRKLAESLAEEEMKED